MVMCSFILIVVVMRQGIEIKRLILLKAEVVRILNNPGALESEDSSSSSSEGEWEQDW